MLCLCVAGVYRSVSVSQVCECVAVRVAVSQFECGVGACRSVNVSQWVGDTVLCCSVAVSQGGCITVWVGALQCVSQ